MLKNCQSLPVILGLLLQLTTGDAVATPGCPGCEQKTVRGKAQFDCGNYGTAEQYLTEIVKLFEQDPSNPSEKAPYAVALQNLGLVYYFEGKLDDASATYTKALPLTEAAWGPNSLLLADNMHNLARSLRRARKYDEAEPVMKRVIEIRERALGSEHPLVTNAYLDLAVNYGKQRRTNEAELIFHRVIANRDKPGSQMRLVAALEAYVQFLAINHGSPETIRKTQDRIEHLMQTMKDQQVIHTPEDTGKTQKMEIQMLPSVNESHNATSSTLNEPTE